MRVGVVVNPIAGMGGRVGLKGTDGKVEEAKSRGAKARSPDRTVDALAALYEHAPETTVLAYGGTMGEEEARKAGFDPLVIGNPDGEVATASDTRDAIHQFTDEGVDIVIFAGGDGTATDVADALSEFDDPPPVLGIPTGVKVYSGVFAVTPRAAGEIAATFEATEMAEVVDVDEEAFRGGEVRTNLKSVVTVPAAPSRQASKQLAGGTVEGLAMAIASELDSDVTYVLGPGSTVGAIKEVLGFSGSPLGVDVYRDGSVVARDAGETDILDALCEQNVVIVSPIGGQGFIFGRGNDQISPAVIEKSNVQIVASRRKLDGLGVLRVDTGDDAVDDSLRGWTKVRIGRYEHRMMQVV